MSKASTSPGDFVVIYDDQDCIQTPMVWDDECEGAICGYSTGQEIALFGSRAEAAKAIEISARFAALNKSQGKPHNDDFLSFRKNLKTVKCRRIATES